MVPRKRIKVSLAPSKIPLLPRVTHLLPCIQSCYLSPFRRKPNPSSPQRTWRHGSRSAWTTLATTTSPSTRRGGSSDGLCCPSGPGQGLLACSLSSAPAHKPSAAFLIINHPQNWERQFWAWLWFFWRVHACGEKDEGETWEISAS